MAGGRFELTRLPGGLLALALIQATADVLRREWSLSILYRWLLTRPVPEGLNAVTPANPRPASPSQGRAILAGRYDLAAAVLDVGTAGDPWDRPSPSLAFARDLHSMAWLPDLLSVGPDARAEALRLVVGWSRIFAKWNAFSWGEPVLSRRIFALACALPELLQEAAEPDRSSIINDFARQARHLLASRHRPQVAAHQAIAVALAGCILSGKAGDQLLKKGLDRLVTALSASLEASGGHASRSPQAALELMFDLQTLAGALHQRGTPPPPSMVRAMETLHQTLQVFILRDGCLPDMQGGEACRPSYIAAARIEAPTGALPAGRNGYQRMDGRSLQVVVDAAAPAEGPWSAGACAQPLGLDVLVHSRRLIVACGWSPGALGPQALRLVDAGSTLTVGDGGCGVLLSGLAAKVLGTRLNSTYREVDVRRHEAEGGIWLDLQHDAWARRYQLRHERRLFLDLDADELRGEDRLTPLVDGAAAETKRRLVPFTLRFHLHPTVRASQSRDGRSVVLQAGDAPIGWRLRSDAQDISIEASVYFDSLRTRRSQQVVLRGMARVDSGARVRWKLAADPQSSSRIDVRSGAL